MRLTRLDVSLDQLEDLPVLVTDEERPVVVRVHDADTVVALAAVGATWEGSWGVWLEASAAYPASIIARDVKTLAAVMDIDHVVVDAAENADAHAEVVRALLEGGPVTLENDVAHLRHAYNRPVPTRPITVWSTDEEGVASPSRRLRHVDSGEALAVYDDDSAHESDIL